MSVMLYDFSRKNDHPGTGRRDSQRVHDLTKDSNRAMILLMSQPDDETIGQRLRRVRRERGLSQTELSSDGVSTSYVSYLERDRRVASHKALRVLGNKLGVSAEYLETGETTSGRDTTLLDAELELRLGSVKAALPRFEEALERAQSLGDTQTATRAVSGLILTAAALGDHAGAVERFEGTPTVSRPGAAVRPALYATVARSLAALGRTPEAISLLQASLEEITASDIVDDALYVRFAVDLSYAHSDCGDLSAAHQILADAIQRAGGLSDPYARIRLYWSLGRLSDIDGEPEVAATYFKRAMTLLEGTEDHFYLASAHEALACALLDQSDPDAALQHLDTAEELYRRTGAPAHITSLTVERARHAVDVGELERAKNLALGALDELDAGTVDPDDTGTCWRTLARVYAELGETDLADHCFTRSIESLEAGAPVKPLADTLHAYAEFLNTQGKYAEAYETLKQANGLTRSESGERAAVRSPQND